MNSREPNFKNATGALKLVEYDNTTKVTKQLPEHDATYSRNLQGGSKRVFAQAKEEINLQQPEFNIRPAGNPLPTQKPVTTGDAPQLIMAERHESIQQRVHKPVEVKEPAWKTKCQERTVRPADITHMGQQITTTNGQINSVVVIKEPIIQTQNTKQPHDTYFHGGNIFDDYTGAHK